MKLAIASLLVLSSLPAWGEMDDHQAKFRLWEGLRTPLPGEAESIGSYSAGCLKGARKLPSDGTGFSVMRLSRSRDWGHPELVSYLKELGQEARKAGLPRLLIGDLGRPRGGPMRTGHSSHQSGLDVDIWYRFSKKKPSRKDREKWGAPSHVTSEGKIKKSWGKKERALVALAASSEKVERIFVHAAIKKDLCSAYPNAPWLYKLRPWWGHDDHLHVRLKCPEGSAGCTPQESVAALGPQCGEELDWWFSQEAREEWEKKKAGFGRTFPELPASCNELASEQMAQGGASP